MSDQQHAPRGLLGLADDADTAASKLAAAIDTANAETASTFEAMFSQPVPLGGDEAIAAIAREQAAKRATS